MSRILIADDHRGTAEAIALALDALGHKSSVVHDGEAAVNAARDQFYDLALLDVRMPKKDGIQALTAIKEDSPETAVVVMSAHGTIDVAVEAMRQGAADFVTKPVTLEEIEVKVANALRQRVVWMENAYLREQDGGGRGFDSMVGAGEAMRVVYERIQAVAQSNATVLVLGETGTGKELVARAIHENSRRGAKPFVRVNCAALAEGVLESELFGHERGAFTNADRQRAGRFELADGGTLFLDEIGEVAIATQVKLLRVLQEKEFERVGGASTIGVDVRIVAATNRDLAEMVDAGEFREDLYYRLNVVPVALPPLRDRRDDIPGLVAHFVLKYAAEMAKKIAAVHPDAMRRLVGHAWPGNVRELENTIERAVVLAPSDTITPEDLGLTDRRGRQRDDPGDAVPIEGVSLTDMVDSFEKRLLWTAYVRSNRVKADAAKLLGIERTTFRYKFDRHGLADLDETAR